MLAGAASGGSGPPLSKSLYVPPPLNFHVRRLSHRKRRREAHQKLPVVHVLCHPLRVHDVLGGPYPVGSFSQVGNSLFEDGGVIGRHTSRLLRRVELSP